MAAACHGRGWHAECLTPRGLWAGPEPGAVGFGPRFVAAVAVGSTLNPINSSIIAIALVSIGRHFAVGADATTWLVAALYLATAVGQPTMGKLADRLGPRRVYLTGLTLLAAGGLLGFFGVSLGMLVVARVVIGLGTSAAYPAAMAMVRRQSERLERQAPGSVLGALAIAAQSTMAVGPPLGGLLIALGGWRWTFLVNVPLAAVGVALALRWLPRDAPRGDRGRGAWRALDPPGLALFVAALASLLFFLMGLATPQWWLLAAAVVLLAALAWWELRARLPFIDVRMLARNRPLTATYLRYTVVSLATYSFVYGWTQWLEQVAGLSPAASGLLLMPSFVVAATVSTVTTRRRHGRGPLLLGATVLVVGSGCLLFLTAGTPLWALVGVSVIFGVQNSLNFVGNQAAMYAQAPDDQIGTAAGLLRTAQYLGAILSASLISITYGERATSAGLHGLATVLSIVAAVLLILLLLSGRNLGRQLNPVATDPEPR